MAMMIATVHGGNNVTAFANAVVQWSRQYLSTVLEGVRIDGAKHVSTSPVATVACSRQPRVSSPDRGAWTAFRKAYVLEGLRPTSEFPSTPS
ncbi:hypothetical protein MMC07_009121 [Pseudocyphellaria aurata]|nr:hypothetical protein [Pseudocyphellaria aurata]